jgi:hypothetical protein
MILFLLTMATLGLSADPAGCETRRALLIGIDRYDQGPSVDNSVRGRDSGRRNWPNLQGSVNDATAIREILLHRFGFQEADIVLLTNQEATRARILAEIDRHLIDPVKPGDHSILFYAGHGSRVKNSNSPELDKKDETIVPADANFGDSRKSIVDIRDKEWDRLFTRILDKGARLTAIFDSCHSGSISRGIAPTTTRIRFLGEDERDVATLVGHEPAPHAPGMEPEHREGALIVSSAQEDQFASEAARRAGDRKEWHGAFTLALMDTLNHLPPDAAAERVFDRVTAKLKALGLQQDPVLAGLPSRRRAPLFGGHSAHDPDRLHLNVIHSDEADDIILQGGRALGLTPGTELVPTHDRSGEPMRVRITHVEDLLRSRASVVQGNWKAIRAGDEFEVARWGAAAEQSLRVYIPPASVDEQAALRFASALRRNVTAAGIAWVEDPAEEVVTHVVMWSGKEWILAGPDGRVTRLGSDPPSEGVLAHLPKTEEIRLFVNLPPSSNLRDALVPVGKAGEGRAQLTQEAEESHYLLVGRLADQRAEYAWMLRNASPGNGSPKKVSLPLPVRTAWGAPSLASGACREGGLKDCLPLLSKLFHWLNIEGPADDRRFPYRLAFFPLSSLESDRTDQLHEGIYRLALESDAATIATIQATWGIQARYVYVFVIDHEGKSTLLFPNEASKEREHLLPRLGGHPTENKDLVLVPMGDSAVIEVHAPFGNDTYLLLSSTREIPRVKELVESDAVGASARRMRGQTDWSISRRFMQSLPASAR